MNLRTKGGYDFFEVASALQKEIKRVNEENAMDWAVELSGRYPDFTWYRLGTIGERGYRTCGHFDLDLDRHPSTELLGDSQKEQETYREDHPCPCHNCAL